MSSPARSSISTARRGSSRSATKSPSGSSGGRRLAARLGEELDLVRPVCRARRPTSPALPSVRSASSEARLNRGRLPESLARCGRRAAEVGEERRLGAGQAVELDEAGPQLGEEVVEQAEVRRDVVAARGRDRRRVLGLVDEVGDLVAALGELADRLARVLVQLADRGALAAQGPGDLFQVGQRRRAQADRLVERLRVAREARAELVDEQAEALLERLAHRVLDEVGLDGLRDPRRGDRAPVLQGLPRRLAVDEVLGDQRLGLGRALRVLAEDGELVRDLDARRPPACPRSRRGSVTSPTFTPETRTSDCSTMPKALYISI